MKKFTFLLTACGILLCNFSISQESRIAPSLKFSEKEVSVRSNNSRAQGDTLFLFDGRQFFVTAPQDQQSFEFEIFDGDSVQPDSAMVSAGWTSEFMFLLSTDTTFLFPDYDNDTAYFIGSTSWLETPGQVDNWFSFGPITVPQSGAMLSWYHMIPAVNFSDGYRVFISTTGVSPVADVDTTQSPIFNRPDCIPGACPEDTLWTRKAVSLSNYAGDSVWVHFNHNANDMFVLYLDMIAITEEAEVSLSVEKDKISNFNNFPNPVKHETTITYGLVTPSDVTLIIYDVAGKEVINIKQGFKSKGNHRINISTSEIKPGVYFYSLITEGKRETRKMVVVE